MDLLGVLCGSPPLTWLASMEFYMASSSELMTTRPVVVQYL